MENQRVLVTGCAGRVGAALAIQLAGTNEVHGIDCVTGRPRRELEQAGVVFHELFLGRDKLDPLPETFDYVFHEAVTWDVKKPEDERRAYHVSVKGVADLLRKYRDAKRFVLGSTGGVCAPSDKPIDESALRQPDATPYHSYKFGMEVVGELFADSEGADIVIGRYYWPWSEHNGFLHTWVIVPLLRGEPVSVCDGHPARFTPIFMPDCVRYTIGLAELPECPRVVNVSGAEIVSLRQTARITADILGVQPAFANHRRPMLEFLGDTSLLHKLLGPPEYDIRRALEAAVQWHRDHPEEHKTRDIFDAPRHW